MQQTTKKILSPTLMLALGNQAGEAIERAKRLILGRDENLDIIQTATIIDEDDAWAISDADGSHGPYDWSQLKDVLASRLGAASSVTAIHRAAEAGYLTDSMTRRTLLATVLGDPQHDHAILPLSYLAQNITQTFGQVTGHYAALLQIPPNYSLDAMRKASIYAVLRELDHFAQEASYAAPWGVTLENAPFDCCWILLDQNLRGQTLSSVEEGVHLLGACVASLASSALGARVHSWHEQIYPRTGGHPAAFGSCGAAFIDAPVEAFRARLAEEIESVLVSETCVRSPRETKSTSPLKLSRWTAISSLAHITGSSPCQIARHSSTTYSCRWSQNHRLASWVGSTPQRQPSGGE